MHIYTREGFEWLIGMIPTSNWNKLSLTHGVDSGKHKKTKMIYSSLILGYWIELVAFLDKGETLGRPV